MKSLQEYLNESLTSIAGQIIWPEGKQLIFTVIKPGFLEHSQEIISKFKEHGWELYKTTTKTLLRAEAEHLYTSHKKEDFFEPLCEYMASGPSMAIMYTRPGRHSEDVFKDVDKLKDEIRETWGESDMRNVMHSSASTSEMDNEMKVYF